MSLLPPMPPLISFSIFEIVKVTEAEGRHIRPQVHEEVVGFAPSPATAKAKAERLTREALSRGWLRCDHDPSKLGRVSESQYGDAPYLRYENLCHQVREVVTFQTTRN